MLFKSFITSLRTELGFKIGIDKEVLCYELFSAPDRIKNIPIKTLLKTLFLEDHSEEFHFNKLLERYIQDLISYQVNFEDDIEPNAILDVNTINKTPIQDNNDIKVANKPTEESKPKASPPKEKPPDKKGTTTNEVAGKEKVKVKFSNHIVDYSNKDVSAKDLTMEFILHNDYWPVSDRRINQTLNQLHSYEYKGVGHEIDILGTINKIVKERYISDFEHVKAKVLNINHVTVLVDRSKSMIPFLGYIDRILSILELKDSASKINVLYYKDYPKENLYYRKNLTDHILKADYLSEVDNRRSKVLLISDLGIGKLKNDINYNNLKEFLNTISSKDLSKVIWLNPYPQNRLERSNKIPLFFKEKMKVLNLFSETASIDSQFLDGEKTLSHALFYLFGKHSKLNNNG